MTVDLCMAYRLILVSITLTLLQSHSGSAEGKKALNCLQKKSIKLATTVGFKKIFFTWPHYFQGFSLISLRMVAVVTNDKNYYKTRWLIHITIQNQGHEQIWPAVVASLAYQLQFACLAVEIIQRWLFASADTLGLVSRWRSSKRANSTVMSSLNAIA